MSALMTPPPAAVGAAAATATAHRAGPPGQPSPERPAGASASSPRPPRSAADRWRFETSGLPSPRAGDARWRAAERASREPAPRARGRPKTAPAELLPASRASRRPASPRCHRAGRGPSQPGQLQPERPAARVDRAPARPAAVMQKFLALPLPRRLFLVRVGAAAVAGLIALLLLLLLILPPRHATIIVRSDPDQATVQSDGQPLGETPITVELKRNAVLKIALHKDGYEDADEEISAEGEHVVLIKLNKQTAEDATKKPVKPEVKKDPGGKRPNPAPRRAISSRPTRPRPIRLRPIRPRPIRPRSTRPRSTRPRSTRPRPTRTPARAKSPARPSRVSRPRAKRRKRSSCSK